MGNIDPVCISGPFEPGVTSTGEIPQYIKLETPAFSDPNYSGITLQIQPTNYVNAYSKTYTEAIVNMGGVHFTPNTYSTLIGNGTIYRPGLLARDVWKWDLSGESDYGVIEPPTTDPNYDTFDSNWAAQFVVFSQGNNINCATLGFGKCSHNKGIVPRGEFDPYQECSSTLNMRPDSLGYGATAAGFDGEPTYLDIIKKYKAINECALIEGVLGKDYLGCLYEDPTNSCSCNCPERGASFGDYLTAIKTNATFWGTDLRAPLYRNAQIRQFTRHSLEITISGFMEGEVKLGEIVTIENWEAGKRKENSGDWMVFGITYKFQVDNFYSLTLLLMRDAVPVDSIANDLTGGTESKSSMGQVA